MYLSRISEYILYLLSVKSVFKVKKSIYFCTFKEIKKGQELKAWYAPHYAEKMGASVQNMVHSSDEEFQEIVRSVSASLIL